MNKVLIIEDDLEINALLADFLKEKGYAVHCQYDGLHVLDFLNKEKIDLIILDIMLTGSESPEKKRMGKCRCRQPPHLQKSRILRTMFR